MCIWLLTAFASAVGAFFGGLGSYFLSYKLALRKELSAQKTEYLCLLLLIYEELESLRTLFIASLEKAEDTKKVTFDLPLPELAISPIQMQRLFELAPDKQMPAALMKTQHFLKSHSRRVEKSGLTQLPLEFVQRQAEQLKFMLLSVRTQYEQIANAAFPLDEISSIQKQTTQQTPK